MTAGDFYYVRPDQSFSGGTVTGGADTGYLDEWIVDGRPGRPFRATNGSPSLTIGNGSSVTVTFASVCGHNLDAAETVTLGGGITATLTAPALPPNGIPINPWTNVNSASTASITLAITGNSQTVVIGEAIFGTRSTLERNLRPAPTFAQAYKVVRHDAEFNSLMPYDKAIVSRTLRGSNIYTDTGLQAILDWYDSTRGGTKPTLIVPNSNVQDAWLVEMAPPSYQPLSLNRNEVTLEFTEYPRSRW